MTTEDAGWVNGSSLISVEVGLLIMMIIYSILQVFTSKYSKQPH